MKRVIFLIGGAFFLLLVSLGYAQDLASTAYYQANNSDSLFNSEIRMESTSKHLISSEKASSKVQILKIYMGFCLLCVSGVILLLMVGMQNRKLKKRNRNLERTIYEKELELEENEDIIRQQAKIISNQFNELEKWQ